MSTLSERIQQILDEHPGELDQPKLGEVAGCSKSVVNQWLGGKIKSLDYRYARNIKKGLGYNVDWLILGEGKPRPQPEDVNSVNRDQKAPLSTQATMLFESIIEIERRAPRAADRLTSIFSQITDLFDEQARIAAMLEGSEGGARDLYTRVREPGRSHAASERKRRKS
jgi:transcriptional regulator with XRE-family HTH domain